MENNITKIPIKNSGKGVTLLNSWKTGYGPSPLVLTFTDDPPLWGPSPPPPPPKKKRTFPKFGEFGIGSTNNPLVEIFLYSHYCLLDIVLIV